MVRRLLAFLPGNLRRSLRLFQRFLSDCLHGHIWMLARNTGSRTQWPAVLSVEQRIAPGPTLDAKLHNMQLAIRQIQHLDLNPGKVLSFWKLTGNPGQKQGFQPGRNIIRGQLVQDYGGGLCQLSSAMYELALRAGITVIERHAHSTNVYTPETSYTTLGLDATLAYGYKDLRIFNNTDTPFNFSFELSRTRICVRLHAPANLPDMPLRVQHFETPEGLTAKVYRQSGAEEHLLSSDFYRAWKE